MTLLDSLLDAIVRLEGDALVMHVGEKPYVVTTSSAMSAYRGPLAWGQVELSSRVLTADAVLGMVGQILPSDQRRALDEFGAVEHEITSPAGVHDRFTVVAARGGDDIWLELRRHPVPVAAPVEIGSVSDAASADGEAASGAGAGAAAAVGLEELPSRGAGWAATPAPDAGMPPGAHTSPPGQDREAEIGPADHASALRPDEPGADAAIPRAAATPAESGYGEAQPADVRATIEERVPVLDEVGDHRPEHVEHIVIPVSAAPPAQPPSSDVAEPQAEGAAEHAAHEDAAEFEIVEPEVQRSPTDDDVEAMLAATAAALLEASAESERPPDADAAREAADFFEVVSEDAAEADVLNAPEPAGMDLTRAPGDIPPQAAWTPAAVQGPAEPDSTASAEPPIESAKPVEALSEESASAPAVESMGADVPVPPPQPAPAAELPAAAALAAMQASAAAPGSPPTSETASPEPPVPEPPAVPAPAPDLVPMEQAPELALAGHDQDDEPIWAIEQPSALPEMTVDQFSGIPITTTAHEAHATAAAPAAGAAIATPGRPEAGGRVDDQVLLHVLQTAVERGGSTVYVVAQSKPMLRVDGEISALESGPVLSAEDVERLIAALSPPKEGGHAPAPEGTEWVSHVPRIGRVRCLTFVDHRGPGIIFRLISTRTISADYLNVSTEIRDLCAQTDGLVLVTGARTSGKTTLVNSLIDVINRTRSDHVVTVEAEIAFAHESQRSFVSQREIAEPAAAAGAIRAALREDPDVLMVEEVTSAEVAAALLEAADSGRLVLASITAPSAASAVDALVQLLPEPGRAAARATMSAALRGVVSQVLVRRTTGGRTAARELLLNTSQVAPFIVQGDTQKITAALEAGQRQGMVPLSDSLASLVKAGSVHPAEAVRRAPDRKALLAAFERDGLDTSFAERAGVI